MPIIDGSGPVTTTVTDFVLLVLCASSRALSGSITTFHLYVPGCNDGRINSYSTQSCVSRRNDFVFSYVVPFSDSDAITDTGVVRLDAFRQTVVSTFCVVGWYEITSIKRSGCTLTAVVGIGTTILNCMVYVLLSSYDSAIVLYASAIATIVYGADVEIPSLSYEKLCVLQPFSDRGISTEIEFHPAICTDKVVCPQSSLFFVHISTTRKFCPSSRIFWIYMSEEFAVSEVVIRPVVVSCATQNKENRHTYSVKNKEKTTILLQYNK